MRIAQLIGHLSRNGGHFKVLDDDRLEYIGPKELLTDEIRRRVRAQRKGIVAWLRTPADDHPPEDQLELSYAPTAPNSATIVRSARRDGARGATEATKATKGPQGLPAGLRAMPTDSLAAWFAVQGLTLSVEGDEIACSGPTERLSGVVQFLLCERGDDLAAFLAGAEEDSEDGVQAGREPPAIEVDLEQEGWRPTPEWFAAVEKAKQEKAATPPAPRPEPTKKQVAQVMLELEREAGA